MSNGLDTDTLESNTEDGKSRRRYDSPRRRAQAAATHQAVLDAGRRLFVEQGYARTTMRDVAAEAGVAVDSVYAHFRTKTALLTALMDQAHGEPADTAVSDRDWVREVRTADDLGAALDTLARHLTEVYRAQAPLALAVRRAADADPTAAEIAEKRSADRLAGLAGLAERVATTPGAALDDADRILDVLYALTSPEMFGLLSLDRGWGGEHYATWLAAALRHQLLAP